MERIQKYKIMNIEELSSIYGGVTRASTYQDNKNPTVKTDIKISHSDKCTWEIVENLGFINWLTGDRQSTTYNNCGQTQGSVVIKELKGVED